MNWLIVLLASAICSILGAAGGSKNVPKAVRRFGIPVTLALFTWSWIPLLCAVGLSLGYGIPDATDEGGTIGKFYARFIKDRTLLDVAVRGTVGLVGAAPLVFLVGWWAALIPVSYILWGAIVPGEPVFKIGKYEILGEDLAIYAAYGVAVI